MWKNIISLMHWQSPAHFAVLIFASSEAPQHCHPYSDLVCLKSYAEAYHFPSVSLPSFSVGIDLQIENWSFDLQCSDWQSFCHPLTSLQRFLDLFLMDWLDLWCVFSCHPDLEFGCVAAARAPSSSPLPLSIHDQISLFKLNVYCLPYLSLKRSFMWLD